MILSGFLLGFKLQLNIQSEWQLFPLSKSPQELEDLDLRTLRFRCDSVLHGTITVRSYCQYQL